MMASTKPVAPPTQWAQRKEVVYVSILAEDVKDLDVKIDAAKVHFSGKSGPEQKEYAVDLELFAEVDPETSKYVVKDRLIDITLKKKECDSPFWPRLLKGTGKPGWLKTDFGRWKDEDEEGADEDAGDSGADFQSMMHQMGGAGGMGMGGMGMGGGDDAFPPYDPKDDVDSDDENGDPEDMPKLEE